MVIVLKAYATKQDVDKLINSLKTILIKHGGLYGKI